MTEGNNYTLVEELRDEWHRLMRHSIDKGSADAGISANLAERAANEIEELRRERDRYKKLHEETFSDLVEAAEQASKAEAALAKAVKVIAPLMKATYLYAPVTDRSATEARKAASAFAAKHGGRDG